MTRRASAAVTGQDQGFEFSFLEKQRRSTGSPDTASQRGSEREPKILVNEAASALDTSLVAVNLPFSLIIYCSYGMYLIRKLNNPYKCVLSTDN